MGQQKLSWATKKAAMRSSWHAIQRCSTVSVYMHKAYEHMQADRACFFCVEHDHLLVTTKDTHLPPDTCLPALCILTIPRSHNHDSVTPPGQGLGQGPHHIPQPPCIRVNIDHCSRCFEGCLPVSHFTQLLTHSALAAAVLCVRQRPVSL